MTRIPMSLRLRPQTFKKQWPCRAVRMSDSNDLAMLLYAAFRGTIDDEGEPFSAAEDEIAKTLAGGYGRLLADCSFVAEEGSAIISACLVSWYEPVQGPFVVFTMTRPESKGQGMARFLLQKSINALIEQGERQLTLIVTDGNVSAQQLYASLGFVAIEKT